jgi:hypothetical protein
MLKHPLKPWYLSTVFSALKVVSSEKLRWVENGVNRNVGASECGAGHSFVFLFGLSWFYHISVTGQYCPSYRQVLEK